MIRYNPKLKGNERRLRSQMTDAERALWARWRRKQVRSVQFCRQKPLGDYIVDFYGPKARIGVEVDGSRHMGSEHASMDSDRDAYLASESLWVLRFDNLRVVSESLEGNPPQAPF